MPAPASPAQSKILRLICLSSFSFLYVASAEAKPIILLALKLERFIPISSSGSSIFNWSVVRGVSFFNSSIFFCISSEAALALFTSIDTLLLPSLLVTVIDFGLLLLQATKQTNEIDRNKIIDFIYKGFNFLLPHKCIEISS